MLNRTQLNGVGVSNRLREEMDRLFDSFLQDWSDFASSGTSRKLSAFPALNVWADDDNLFVEAELPGLKMDEINLLLTGDELTISGEKKPVDHEGTSCLRSERNVGRFSRTIRLPFAVVSGKAEAILRDGVLNLTLPKAEEAKPKRIAVHQA